METQLQSQTRANLRQFYEYNMSLASIESTPNYRFMHAVDQEITSALSHEALAKVLGSLKINLNEFGLKVALEEKTHVVFAKFIDQTHEYSLKHYGSEEFFITMMQSNPLSINIVL